MYSLVPITVQIEKEVCKEVEVEKCETKEKEVCELVKVPDCKIVEDKVCKTEKVSLSVSNR